MTTKGKMIHNNEVIAIEEDLLNYRLMIRQFTLHNRTNNLKIGILTLGATVVSCKLDDGQSECVINTCGTNWGITTSAQYLSRPNWISHVRGLDTLSLTTGAGSSQSQSIVYRLTPDNELIVIGKLKSQHQLLHPQYFNLNSVIDKASLDGHLLHVRSSDGSALILQNDGTIEDRETLNFAGDTPCAISSDCSEYDAIYCVNGTDAAIIATLQYATKTIEVTLQHIQLQQQQQNPNTFPCRLRIRITNGGVSFIPSMMNEFKCIYKFLW